MKFRSLKAVIKSKICLQGIKEVTVANVIFCSRSGLTTVKKTKEILISKIYNM